MICVICRLFCATCCWRFVLCRTLININRCHRFAKSSWHKLSSPFSLNSYWTFLFFFFSLFYNQFLSFLAIYWGISFLGKKLSALGHWFINQPIPPFSTNSKIYLGSWYVGAERQQNRIDRPTKRYKNLPSSPRSISWLVFRRLGARATKREEEKYTRLKFRSVVAACRLLN